MQNLIHTPGSYDVAISVDWSSGREFFGHWTKDSVGVLVPLRVVR